MEIPVQFSRGTYSYGQDSRLDLIEQRPLGQAVKKREYKGTRNNRQAGTCEQ